METGETQRINDATLLVKAAEKLFEAQREIDDLVLQFAFGKAEAHDKFEETKNEFRSHVSEFKRTKLGAIVATAAVDLKILLEELEGQLNLGKVDTKDRFEEQKGKIEAAIDKLRSAIKNLKNETFDREHLDHEIEKFKLKLEVIRLRFVLKKFEVRDSFKESMHQAKRKIEKTTSNIKDKVTFEKSVLDDFRKDAKDIYKHLRKIIQSI